MTPHPAASGDSSVSQSRAVWLTPGAAGRSRPHPEHRLSRFDGDRDPVDVVAAGVLPYAAEVFSGRRSYPLEPPVVPEAGSIGRIAACGADATQLRLGLAVVRSRRRLPRRRLGAPLTRGDATACCVRHRPKPQSPPAGDRAGTGSGQACSISASAIPAAVGRASVPSVRVRAEAPSNNRASCSPSSAGSAAPAS